MKENNILLEYFDIFSYNFRRLKYIHRQTQEYISDKTEINRVTIMMLETGKMVSLNTILFMATHFGVNLSEFTKEKEYDTEVQLLLKLSFVELTYIPDSLKNSFLNFFLGRDVVSQADFKRWIDYLEYRRAVYLVKRGGILNKFNNLKTGERFHYDGRHHAFLFDLVSNTKEGTYLLSNKSGTHNCTKIC